MRPILFSLFLIATATSAKAQQWSQLGTGANSLNARGDIYTVCTDNHGNIYAAGWFYDDTSYSALSVYKWNGATWTELGHGSTALDPTGNTVREIMAIYADSSGNVYAAATNYDSSLTHPFYVAKWDGTSWSPLGVGGETLYSIGDICVITADKYGNIYTVGGFFEDTVYGGHGYVAKWDGSSWSEVGTEPNRLNANGFINAMFIDTSGNIYVGGYFTDDTTVDTLGNIYIAKWDGTSWSQLGSSICPAFIHGGEVFSIVGDTLGNIYAAGNFYSGADSFTNVIKWDGYAWSSLTTESTLLTSHMGVTSLCVDKFGFLYAAGDFTDTTVSIPPVSYQYYQSHPCFIAKWDGSTWTKLGTGSDALYANNFIGALCTDNDGNIYTAGGFTDTTITFRQVWLDPEPDTNYLHPRFVAKYSPLSTDVYTVKKNIDLSIYPNPATNTLTISSSAKVNSIEVYNTLGQQVYSCKPNATMKGIDISHTSPGAYFIRINGTEERKFIKE